MVNAPNAPTLNAVNLRGDYANATADYQVAQDYDSYTVDEQAIWRELYARQLKLLPQYAAPEFCAGVQSLGASPDSIPRLTDASTSLQNLTGWQVIGVPGLIPEEHFFAHLAARRFPVTVWMRRRDELDYLVEPDLFHDFFGHLPMLTHRVFADYVQAYGVLGTRAPHAGALKMLARLYWYTVEFGLIEGSRGLQAYGAGILSSSGETVYALRAENPQRLTFDLERVLRTDYLIDAYQKTYFVLASFDELFDSVLSADFSRLFALWGREPGFVPGEVPVSSSGRWQAKPMLRDQMA
ncbi:MAG TPA: phenylalanine 4-monooxygenase [Steroidobacteraceae bacterium]|nr:phenylalanine 4-monooxygenase [Steroidobacteraceae bacterium]